MGLGPQVYGKEKLMARVARPSTDPQLFAYLAPLLAESKKVIAARSRLT